jgi:hypothetical protein
VIAFRLHCFGDCLCLFFWGRGRRPLTFAVSACSLGQCVFCGITFGQRWLPRFSRCA